MTLSDKTKKGLKTAGTIAEWILIVFSVLFLVFVLVFGSNKPGNGKSGSLFGYETRIVLTSSMDAKKSFYEDKNYAIKSIAAGDAVFIKDVNENLDKGKRDDAFFADLHVGDIITYNSFITGSQTVITHRIVLITGEGDNLEYLVQGDNVESSDYSSEVIARTDGLIIGKVVHKSTFVGWVYTTLFQNKVIVYLIIIIPVSIGIAIEIAKIVSIVANEKKVREQASIKSKDNEIEELKKQLEELKAKDRQENKNGDPK